MHTAADFIRIVAAVAAGCGLYDTLMFFVVRLRQKRYAKHMAAQVDALNARYEELKAQAEAKKA